MHVEVVQESRFRSHLLFYGVDGEGVRYGLYQPAPRPSSQDFVGSQPHIKLFNFENLVHLTDQLHSELLLPDVIVALDYQLYESPSLEATKRRILTDSIILLLRGLQEDRVVGSLIIEVFHVD